MLPIIRLRSCCSQNHIWMESVRGGVSLGDTQRHSDITAMHCISVVIIQNSRGSARCTVQIYRATHAHLHSPAARMNDISAHRSLTVVCIIQSYVKLCADL